MRDNKRICVSRVSLIVKSRVYKLLSPLLCNLPDEQLAHNIIIVQLGLDMIPPENPSKEQLAEFFCKLDTKYNELARKISPALPNKASSLQLRM